MLDGRIMATYAHTFKIHLTAILKVSSLTRDTWSDISNRQVQVTGLIKKFKKKLESSADNNLSSAGCSMHEHKPNALDIMHWT